MGQPQYCLTKIQSSYSQFSKTEQKIADYILQSPENMVHKTIDQVAAELDVAISTVFRFSKRLGFKGYQAMKIALASELSAAVKEIVEEKITENDNEQAITEKLFNSNIRMFKETIQVMDFSSLKKAVDVILKSEKVEFYGTGSSAIVALDAHHKFIGSGISTAAYTDSYLQLKSASQLTEKDTAILISHSGKDEELIRVLEAAKKQGAVTIGITNFSQSPLSQKADYVLYTASNQVDVRSDDTFSKIIQLSLIDALYVNVMSSQKSFLKNSINKLKGYWGK
ncbi:MurR/RpiR family transcriptional regulator [Bacillus taeanensis]|uniref:RpiR family transcriptional regulator n=1 Tax=Bacillus taeanensis TaxID=273032 RepID=A0A366XSD0_9BACI|nr:MurR/RpiR family transcriptional regulator [Bacillus taeanensis]RBW69290.1 RpiR family transcriptional regulator [Bacillus taeanensis]